MKTKIIIAALLIATSFSATAQRARSLKDENRRIRQGAVSGQLTVAETARLKAEEARLKNQAARYKTNDGKVGPVEKAKLLRSERRLDRNIRRQKHDGQTRH